jgi:hypothetical protein
MSQEGWWIEAGSRAQERVQERREEEQMKSSPFALRRVWIGPSNFAHSVVLTSLPKVDSVVEKRPDGIIDTKQTGLWLGGEGEG